MKNNIMSKRIGLIFAIVVLSVFPIAAAKAQYDFTESGVDYGGFSDYSFGGYDFTNSGIDYGGYGYDFTESTVDYGGFSGYGTGYGYDFTESTVDYSGFTDYTGNDGFVPDCDGCDGFVPDQDGFVPDCSTDCQDGFVPDSQDGFVPDSQDGFVPDEDCSNCVTSPSYSPTTPYYSSGCNCFASQPNYRPSTVGSTYGSTYGTSATYGTIASYMPPAAQYAVRNTPAASYIFTPGPVVPPRTQPYTMTTTPTNNTNVNPNTNTNTNNNTNTPTAVATATNGDNTNTNVASTGAITNTFAPVINVNGGGSNHRPVDYEFPRPVCTIYSTGSYNQVNLTWTSQNATTAYISPSLGNVPVNGSRTVYGQGYTTYTLTVTGPGGSATCQTSAAVNAPAYTVTPTYPVAPTPTAPYVSLSQIPYTGFDYGPIGNAIYWTAILAFAASAGYLLVYGMPKFAFAGYMKRSDENTFADESVQEVFKSNLVTADEIATPVVSDAKTFDLPTATSSQAGVTSDAMIIDRSNGTPRIVIARA